MQVTIDVSMSGIAIAEQLLAVVKPERDAISQQRAQMVARHQTELATVDGTLALFDARITELETFVAFKKTR